VDERLAAAVVIVTDDVVVGDALAAAGRRRGVEVTCVDTPPVPGDVLVLELRQVTAGRGTTLDAFFGQIVAGTHALLLDGEAVAQDPLAVLTRRERELCRHLLAGLGTAELATRLGISERTVRTHLQNVFAKLGLAGRAQLVAWAAEAGLTAEGPS
jgi:DNA-binding CsgD family transcriptional regulator